MNKVPLFILLSFFAWGCTVKFKADVAIQTPGRAEQHRPDYSKVKPKVFKNIAIVTLDSTEKWQNPATSFAIEYPEGYTVDYFPDKKYYLRLRKHIEQRLVQEITVGTLYNVRTAEDAMGVLQQFDSVLSVNDQLNYKGTFIGQKQIGNENHYQLRAFANFDKAGIPMFRGDYSVACFILFPPNKELQGANVSFVRSIHNNNGGQELSDEELLILKTFRYIE